MAKQTIQTNLLGIKVQIGDITGTGNGPSTDQANRLGRIRNVYMEKDGSINYSVEVLSGTAHGQLVELYACHFRICALYRD